MVTKKEAAKNERFNAVSWLSPFDNYVWLLIVVTVLVSSIVYWFLEKLNPDSDHRKYQLDAVETLWLLAMYVLMMLVVYYSIISFVLCSLAWYRWHSSKKVDRPTD
jgi:magnesium-transporting ATPase (P-type)